MGIQKISELYVYNYKGNKRDWKLKHQEHFASEDEGESSVFALPRTGRPSLFSDDLIVMTEIKAVLNNLRVVQL